MTLSQIKVQLMILNLCLDVNMRESLCCHLAMVILFCLHVFVFLSLDDSSLDDSAFSTESSEQVSESSSAPETRADRPKPRPRPSKEESPPTKSSRFRNTECTIISLHHFHIHWGCHLTEYHYQRMLHHVQGIGIIVYRTVLLLMVVLHVHMTC